MISEFLSCLKLVKIAKNRATSSFFLDSNSRELATMGKQVNFFLVLKFVKIDKSRAKRFIPFCSQISLKSGKKFIPFCSFCSQISLKSGKKFIPFCSFCSQIPKNSYKSRNKFIPLWSCFVKIVKCIKLVKIAKKSCNRSFFCVLSNSWNWEKSGNKLFSVLKFLKKVKNQAIRVFFCNPNS